jgi:hypothetical protein
MKIIMMLILFLGLMFGVVVIAYIVNHNGVYILGHQFTSQQIFLLAYILTIILLIINRGVLIVIEGVLNTLYENKIYNKNQYILNVSRFLKEIYAYSEFIHIERWILLVFGFITPWIFIILSLLYSLYVILLLFTLGLNKTLLGGIK